MTGEGDRARTHRVRGRRLIPPPQREVVDVVEDGLEVIYIPRRDQYEIEFEGETFMGPYQGEPEAEYFLDWLQQV